MHPLTRMMNRRIRVQRYSRFFQDRMRYQNPGRWDESKHPRASDGRFGSKPGDSAGPDDGPSPEPSGEPNAPQGQQGPPQGTPESSKSAPPAISPEQIAQGDREIEAAMPKSDADMGAFFAAVDNHPYEKEVNRRLAIAAAETKSGDSRAWSQEKYQDENGNYTPERQSLHKQIVDKFLNPKAAAAPGTKPVAFVLMGPPAAGKTTGGQPFADKLGIEFTVVNADDVKSELPEYEGWNAGVLHEESSDVAEGMLQKQALEQRHNTLMDLTGANHDKMVAMVDEFAKAGYDVHIAGVKVPDHLAASRAWKRFRGNAFNNRGTGSPGRHVPVKYVYNGVDSKPDKTYATLKNHPSVKSWAQVDNDVPAGAPPKIMDQGKR